MKEKEELVVKSKVSDVSMLSHELAYQRYLLNQGNIKQLFEKMSLPEYIALHNVAMESELSSIYGERTYLKELSEKMQLTIRQTSKMIGKLRDKGLLTWAHDGDGSEGTYVTITESGKNLLCEQEEVLKKYYGNVIEKFGKEKLIQLLQLMKELETIMSGEFEELEEKDEEENI